MPVTSRLAPADRAFHPGPVRGGEVIRIPEHVIGIRCPYCNSDDCGVVDSRPARMGSIRRRRRCNQCGGRHTTFEISQEVFGSVADIMALDEKLRALHPDDFNLIRTITQTLYDRRRDRE